MKQLITLLAMLLLSCDSDSAIRAAGSAAKDQIKIGAESATEMIDVGVAVTQDSMKATEKAQLVIRVGTEVAGHAAESELKVANKTLKVLR